MGINNQNYVKVAKEHGVVYALCKEAYDSMSIAGSKLAKGISYVASGIIRGMFSVGSSINRSLFGRASHTNPEDAAKRQEIKTKFTARREMEKRAKLTDRPQIIEEGHSGPILLLTNTTNDEMVRRAGIRAQKADNRAKTVEGLPENFFQTTEEMVANLDNQINDLVSKYGNRIKIQDGKAIDTIGNLEGPCFRLNQMIQERDALKKKS